MGALQRLEMTKAVLLQYEHQKTHNPVCIEKHSEGPPVWKYRLEIVSVFHRDEKIPESWHQLNSFQKALPVWPKSIRMNKFSKGKADLTREI